MNSEKKTILRETHPDSTFDVATRDVGHWESHKWRTNPPEESVMILK